MKITDYLRAEHDVFLEEIGELEAMLERGAAPKEVTAAVIVLARAVEAHAKAEHELLYPAFTAAWGGDMSLVKSLAREDEEIWAAARRIAERTQGVVALEKFLSELRRHLARENELLFPMAEASLTDERLESLGQRWRILGGSASYPRPTRPN